MDEPAGAEIEADEDAFTDVWPRRAELLGAGLVVVVALMVAADVAQAIGRSGFSPHQQLRRTLALASLQAAAPFTVGLLVVAVFLAVLDDVLTGQAARRRSPVATATLWSAVGIAGVLAVAGCYAAYEIVVGLESPDGSLTSLVGDTALEVSFVLHLAAGVVVALFAVWLALRALDDTSTQGDGDLEAVNPVPDAEGPGTEPT